MNRKREPVADVVNPTLATCADAGFALAGEIGRCLEAVTRQWILPAPHANPGMLEMFRQRERKPAHDLVPWTGAFAGKYLSHAVQVWRLARDAAAGRYDRTLSAGTGRQNVRARGRNRVLPASSPWVRVSA
jgi:hypothetical protein